MIIFLPIVQAQLFLLNKKITADAVSIDRKGYVRYMRIRLLSLLT